MANTFANRGKYAEGQIKKVLARYALRADTAFQKLADTYSGHRSPALADFIICHQGQMFLLEIKEVEHEFRLPKGNFSLDQIARQKLWQLAGATSMVAIYFKPLKQWRLLPINFFGALPVGVGSWDFREYPLYTLDELMTYLLGN